MIRLQDNTPDVYYNQSRDFQFIGRLYDLVLNSVKTNTDLLYTLPLSDNSDERLLDLMTLTLGFKSKHNYNVKQLSALCSAFASIIKIKGTQLSIETACNALINAEGIVQKAECQLLDDNTKVRIFLPMELTDINLIKDLLVYILPAGVSCEIVRDGTINAPNALTELTTNDLVKLYKNGTLDPETLAPTTGSYVYDNNLFTTIVQIEDETIAGLINANAQDTIGQTVNENTYKPDSSNPIIEE